MKNRRLGLTGLMVSELGFGCGAVGGLLVRGDEREMRRAVQRAMELGINYFDTARIYGDGRSETNLGAILRELRAEVFVGTKVRLAAEDMRNIKAATIASVEGSLRRLGKERIDLIQLHNGIARERQPGQDWVSVADLEPVVDAFRALQEGGKVRFWGINGLGDTEAVQQAIHAAGAQTVQICYNLLNPTAGREAPAGFPFQDYGRLIDHAARQDMGVIAIRVLAGGALSGSHERHPVAQQGVSPIGSGQAYEEDVARAANFQFLVSKGYVESLVEAALRFALSNGNLSTALVGISSLEQLEQAVRYAERGPLPAQALASLPAVWAAQA